MRLASINSLSLLLKAETKTTASFISKRCNSNFQIDKAPDDKLPDKASVQKRPTVTHAFLAPVKCEFHGVSKHVIPPDLKWIPIYRFNLVDSVRYLVKFKVYFTVFGNMLAVRALIKHLSDPQVPIKTPLLVIGLTFTGMCLLGSYVRKVIFQIYTTEDCKYVRFCRYTLFGRRLDFILPIDQVVPLVDTNINYRRILLEHKFLEPENLDPETYMPEFYREKLRSSLLHGIVLDDARYTFIFGDIKKKTE